MKTTSPPRPSSNSTWLWLVLVAPLMAGCGSLLQHSSHLEDDELYLTQNEEFITDAEYLAFAYEQAGFDAENQDFQEPSRRGGDAFQSNFGYVPQSLRGRSMLRGYMSPYGAGGFGPNPYDPFGNSFAGGYAPYQPGFYDPYNPYGSPMGSPYGYNPYGSNLYGANPFGSSSFGYNPYGWGSGYGGYGGFGTYSGLGNAAGGDLYTGTPVVVAPRTPIWSSTSVNSNGGGGRLLTNKSEEVTGSAGEPETPKTIWRSISNSSSAAGTARTSNARTRSSATGSSRTTSPSTRPASPSSTSRNNSSTRSSTSRGSTSGSRSGSSTRPSSGSSSGRSNSGRSSGRSSGRGGGQSPR